MNLGYKAIIETTAKNIVVLDSNSKELFNETLKELKGATVSNIKQVEKNLVTDVKELLSSEYTTNTINKIVKIIKLACNWYDKKLFINHDNLFFYNIENGLKVLDAIQEKFTKEEAQKVAKRLNRVKFEDDKRLFNDSFDTKLSEIKKEYNILDIDGKFIAMQDNIKKLWLNLDEQQKKEFKDFINGL